MPEDVLEDFELLPATGADLSEDEQLSALFAGTVDEVDDDDLLEPMGRSWAFDFLSGQFYRNGLSPATVSGVDAITVWVEATLRTSRFAHSIFTDEYGLDVLDIVGGEFAPEIAGVYAAAVQDALSAHDRIVEVTDFKFSSSPFDDDALYVEFTTVLDTGEQFVLDTTLGAS